MARQRAGDFLEILLRRARWLEALPAHMSARASLLGPKAEMGRRERTPAKVAQPL
jgi:hypothetical protein